MKLKYPISSIWKEHFTLPSVPPWDHVHESFPWPPWPPQADATALPSLSLEHFTNSSLTLFRKQLPHVPWGLGQDPWDLPQCLFPVLDWGPGYHSGFHAPIHRRGVENNSGNWIRLNKNSIYQNLSQELFRMWLEGKIRNLLFYFWSIEILGTGRGGTRGPLWLHSSLS